MIRKKTDHLCGHYFLVCFLPLLFAGHLAHGEITPVNITGVILAPPPCVINGNKIIDINFGDKIMTNLVDGNNYVKTVDYSVSCSDAPSNSMRMQIKGDTTSFSTSLIKTSNNNLGIELRLNGEKHNGWFNFTYPYIPKLEAVPVKNSSSILEPGPFDGSATLVVEYR